MRSRDALISTVCVIAGVGLMAGAGSRLASINAQRQAMKLISNEPLENAPPSLAFATVAMGAFRGLVVDVLWMRADRLKEEGQFFDAKQLAEWIAALQPRFSAVWEFQAWNMAYNISVAIPAEQYDQRWQWVKNGYELLRDKGIPLNPKAISLYREMARIFQHKIGSFSDDAHKYYKLQLALAMEPLLGPADDAWFKALADAPAEWSQIAADADAAEFINALKAADKTFESDADFAGNYLALRQNPSRFSSATFEVINKYRGTAALDKFDVFAKSYQLRNAWKLDPVLMQELNQKYGPIDFADPNRHLPLDWRHADSHAIYWAVKGLRVAGTKDLASAGESIYSSGEANTDRIVAHSLQNLFGYGKIFIYNLSAEEVNAVQAQAGDPAAKKEIVSKEVFLRPDLRMFEPYNNAIVEIIRKYTDPNRPIDTSYEVGHRNMLRKAVYDFYQAGHIGEAQRIYSRLRRLYPEAEPGDVPVEVYVRNRLREEVRSMTYSKALETVYLMLREAYFRYAMRDDDEAFAREKLAEEIHKIYQAQWEEENRIDLPDFPKMRYMALLDFFNDQQYPPSLRQALLARIKIERPQLAEQFAQIAEEMREEAEKAAERP